MEYSAITHYADKRFCFSTGKGKFLIRLQTKKGDISSVILHFQEKYLPVGYIDTRQHKEMNLAYSDNFLDYFEAEIEIDMVCLRYYFEIKDTEGNVTYYGSHNFYNGPIGDVERMYDCPQTLREEELFVVPEWAKNKVVYQIFPSRFATDKDIPEELWYQTPIRHDTNLQGNLRGIINRLDYIKELGIDVIYLTPIFKSDSGHKYNTFDYYQVDPAFGTKEDLKELVDKAHQRNMYVVLDGVFNHTGTEFFAFRDIMENEENSKYIDWYYIDSFPLQFEWGKRPNFKTFSYFGGMPKLKLTNKEVQDYVIEVASYWIKECDIDGWRLDVADEINHAFWKRFRREIKAVKEDALIIGEIWHHAEDFLEGDEWDSVMNYQFYNSIQDLLIGGSITPSQFIGNLNFVKGNLNTQCEGVLWNLIDSHDTPRFLHSANKSIKKQKLAAAFQLLLPGMPMIYYGDEVAIGGGADPDCRRGMLWDESRQNKSMLSHYKKLLAIRKKYTSLTEGGIVEQYADDERQIIVITRESGEEKCTVVFNCSDDKVSVPEYSGLTNLMTDKKFKDQLCEYDVAVFITNKL